MTMQILLTMKAPNLSGRMARRPTNGADDLALSLMTMGQHPGQRSFLCRANRHHSESFQSQAVRLAPKVLLQSIRKDLIVELEA